MLILLSVNYFLAFLSSVIILLRLNNGQTDNYIVQFRSNLGLSSFKTGGIANLLDFIVFAGLVLVINTALSIKVYPIKRELSIAVLGFGILLLVVATIVSNALLVLR